MLDTWFMRPCDGISCPPIRSDWLRGASKIGALSPLVDAEPILPYEGTNLWVCGASASARVRTVL